MDQFLFKYYLKIIYLKLNIKIKFRKIISILIVK